MHVGRGGHEDRVASSVSELHQTAELSVTALSPGHTVTKNTADPSHRFLLKVTSPVQGIDVQTLQGYTGPICSNFSYKDKFILTEN